MHIIDIELTIDPMIFLYLMVCSIQGFKELWVFKIRYHL